MRIVAISDTHGLHAEISLPPGDVLVHSGDITQCGEPDAIQDFVSWFGAQHFKHKIFIAGNHDFWAEQEPAKMQHLADEASVHYLCGSGVTLEGVHFWGSPQTPRFMDWAFMLADNQAALNHWRQVPDTTDVLITHGPPHGVLDELDLTNNFVDSAAEQRRVGCTELINRVQQITPSLHIFGHIHEGFGTQQVGKTRFLNASQLDNRYRLANLPLSVELSESSQSADNVSSGVKEVHAVSELEV